MVIWVTDINFVCSPKHCNYRAMNKQVHRQDTVRKYGKNVLPQHNGEHIINRCKFYSPYRLYSEDDDCTVILYDDGDSSGMTAFGRVCMSGSFVVELPSSGKT